MAARKWIEYVRLLADAATTDLDSKKEEIDDTVRDLAATTYAQQKSLTRTRIARARTRLAKAVEQQREIRAALLLDDEEADG